MPITSQLQFFFNFSVQCFRQILLNQIPGEAAMATNTNNSTSLPSNESEFLPAFQCVPWIAVLIIECLTIVILNIIAIIVFATRPLLCRRGTGLLIRNLAIVDLLVGAISGPLQIERAVGGYCDLWENYDKIGWVYHLKSSLLHLFSMASLANLAAISSERMHATLRHSQHRSVKMWVYKLVVAVIWSIAVIRESLQIVLIIAASPNTNLETLINSTLYLPYYFVSLFVICFCYICIHIRLRCRIRLDLVNNAVNRRERKLTFTLFIVTVASLLTIAPLVVYMIVRTLYSVSLNLSGTSSFHIRMFVIMFFLANSLVNPIIYSMRMRGFCEGFVALFFKTPNRANVPDVPLCRI